MKIFPAFVLVLMTLVSSSASAYVVTPPWQGQSTLNIADEAFRDIEWCASEIGTLKKRVLKAAGIDDEEINIESVKITTISRSASDPTVLEFEMTVNIWGTSGFFRTPTIKPSYYAVQVLAPRPGCKYYEEDGTGFDILTAKQI